MEMKSVLVALFNVIWIGVVLFFALRAQRANWLAELARENAIVQWFQSRDKRADKRRQSFLRQYRDPLPEDALRFPNPERDGFVLIDLARAAISEAPEGPVPTLSQKRAIRPGDLAGAVVFRPSNDESEPIWLRVTARPSPDLFEGEVTRGQLLAPGLRIVFHANHIGMIERPPPPAGRH